MRDGPGGSRRRLFGTDGVRGEANRPPMTVETALEIGKAVAHLFRHAARAGDEGRELFRDASRGAGGEAPDGAGRTRVVIGKDTRRSGYMFETALAAGVTSMGADVWLTGPLPTPAIAHLTSSMRADAGIVVSASHNPFEDNGIKVFGADGFKLPDAIEAEIERLMGSETLARARPSGAAIGRAVRIDDARGRYVAFLKSQFPRDLTLEGARVVVDCANGAAYRAAPAVFSELGADVFALSARPDGRNINAACGALHPQRAAESVVARGADLGVALDGDADRCILIDERGCEVDGDEVMAILATRMLRARALRRRTLVATVMSNLGLQRALARAGGRLLRTAVGDRYVVEAMRAGGYNFGGEQSGHLIFLDHATTGDGLAAALQVLAVMRREGRRLSELRRVMRRVPQVLVNVRVARGATPDADPAVRAAVREVERALGDRGRVLVRMSGTEPKARVMVEGPSARGIGAQARRIATAIERACGEP